MADNITLPGTGAVVRSDDVAGIHYQGVKLFTSEADSAEPLGDTDLGASRALWVDQRRDMLPQTVASGGLTTATTNYAAGDTVGNGWTFTNMARASGLGGFIKGVTIFDKADVLSGCDLYIASASITFGTDNSAPSVSDTDILKCRRLSGFGFVDLGGARMATLDSLDFSYFCDATSLFVYMVSTVANNFFAATTDVHIMIDYERA
jgi:hypothetical protein